MLKRLFQGLTHSLSARACPFCGGTCRPARNPPRDENAPCLRCGYNTVPQQAPHQRAVSLAGPPG